MPIHASARRSRGEELDERAREVLAAVVEQTIASGGPVGSGQLTRTGDFDLSPATLRNVMAELEEFGYLAKPHTSAGRVPTDRGYRYFVDTLMQVQEPPAREREWIESELTAGPDDESVRGAGRVLRLLSNHAVVVSAPKPSAFAVQSIEFLKLRDDRVVAILIGTGDQVQNRLVRIAHPVTADELVHAANYLNEFFNKSLSVQEVRALLMAELESERAQYDAAVARALTLGAAATNYPKEERVVVEGVGSLLELREFSADLERMRALYRALDEKHKLLSLLERVQRANQMQLFIGAESDFSAQSDVAVVASPYRDSHSVIGTIGVIGPTRMAYTKVLPLVQFTAGVLSSVIAGGGER